MLPPLIRLPWLVLGTGNHSPCTAENTSVDDMLDHLLHVAYHDDHTKVRRMATRLEKRARMTVADAMALVHRDAKGNGPLHMAAAAGKVKSCRILMEEFKLKLHVNDAGVDGATPLVCAIYDSGAKDVVSLLLNSGAEPDRTYSNGVAPLHIATIRGNYEVAELLLSKEADVDIWWQYISPLYIAAQHGNERMMRLLLLNMAQSNINLIYTPLKAAIVGHSKIAVELLIEAGADVNAGIPETPLIQAATTGLADIIMCLLNAGADANRTDLIGRTPIEAAATQGWRECVAVLFPYTNRLAGVEDWSIDGIIRHANVASLTKKVQDLLHEGDVSDFEADGDAAFCKRKYGDALAFYHMAIDKNADDSTLYAKRSLCFLHIGMQDNALEDAETFKDKLPNLPEYLQGAAAQDLVKGGPPVKNVVTAQTRKSLAVTAEKRKIARCYCTGKKIGCHLLIPHSREGNVFCYSTGRREFVSCYEFRHSTTC